MTGGAESQDPDADLIRRVGQGDVAAARQMVAAKLPRLLALATRILGDADAAEEVAQDSMVRIWRQAPRWRFGEARFETWLYGVTLNLCRDRLRKRGRVELVSDLPNRADDAPHPDHHLMQREDSQRVEAALQALPPRQREAIVLQYFQELSNGEAAVVMEISVDALESLLARARRSLRQFLAENDYDA